MGREASSTPHTVRMRISSPWSEIICLWTVCTLINIIIFILFFIKYDPNKYPPKKTPTSDFDSGFWSLFLKTTLFRTCTSENVPTYALSTPIPTQRLRKNSTLSATGVILYICQQNIFWAGAGGGEISAEMRGSAVPGIWKILLHICTLRGRWGGGLKGGFSSLFTTNLFYYL